MHAIFLQRLSQLGFAALLTTLALPTPAIAAWDFGRVVDVFSAPKWSALEYSDDGQAGLAVECDQSGNYFIKTLLNASPPAQNEEIALSLFQGTVVIEIDGQRWQYDAHAVRYSSNYLTLTLDDAPVSTSITNALRQARSDILVGLAMTYLGQVIPRVSFAVAAEGATDVMGQLAAQCGMPTSVDPSEPATDGLDDVAP